MSVSPLLKAALTPGSIAFLIVCLAAWLILKYVWPKNRRIARVWILGVTGLYSVLGLPVVATSIAAGLPQTPTVQLSQGERIDTLLVLDGDNRVGRVNQALVVYRMAAVGGVIVLGEAWIVDQLAAAGIPSNRLAQEAGPRTTRAQIEWVKERMAERPGARVALIASRLQMPRVSALVQSAGVTLLLWPSLIDDEPPTTGLWRFVPSYVALRTSRDALYEHAALAYYRWRGWTGTLPR